MKRSIQKPLAVMLSLLLLVAVFPFYDTLLPKAEASANVSVQNITFNSSTPTSGRGTVSNRSTYGFTLSANLGMNDAFTDEFAQMQVSPDTTYVLHVDIDDPSDTEMIVFFLGDGSDHWTNHINPMASTANSRDLVFTTPQGCTVVRYRVDVNTIGNTRTFSNFKLYKFPSPQNLFPPISSWNLTGSGRITQNKKVTEGFQFTAPYTDSYTGETPLVTVAPGGHYYLTCDIDNPSDTEIIAFFHRTTTSGWYSLTSTSNNKSLYINVPSDVNYLSFRVDVNTQGNTRTFYNFRLYDDYWREISLDNDFSLMQWQWGSGLGGGHACEITQRLPRSITTYAQANDSYTNNSQAIPVSGGTQYVIACDNNGGGDTETVVFFYRADGSSCDPWVGGATGGTYAFTTPQDCASIRLRVDRNTAGNTTTYSNFRMYKADDYISCDANVYLSYRDSWDSLPTPTRTGYAFGGWFTERNGQGYNITSIKPTSPYLSVYAKWTPVTYTVAFDGNGSDGGTVPASFSATYDRAFNLPSGVPTRTGYTFKGWTLSADGSGTVYAAGQQNVSNLTSANGATVTLHAKWETNSYTVTFKNGVTGETLKTETVNHGFAATAPTPPAKIKIDGNADSHYTFTGWDTAYNNIIGPTTVTAQYELTGHSYGDYTKTAGSHTRTCDDCGYVDTGVHTYTDAVTAPTCTAQGYTTHTCGACGYSYSDTYTNKAPHDFSVYVEEVAPATCLANATATYKCANCTETTVKAVPDSQLDHSYTGDVKKNDDGTHSFLCVNGCGAYGGTVGCDYDDVITEPTCTEGGYTTHTCTVCGYEYTDAETPKNGHDFSVYVEEIAPATCEANATATYKCANCTETTVKAVPDSQLDHSYTGDVKKNDDGTHSFLCVNGCGAYGGTVGCDYDDVITEPTCTEGGYTTHTCTVCGYEYTDAETPENGHDFSVYVEEITPATCLANATATYKCANCTETTVKAVPDSQLDHSYTGDVKKNDDGTHSLLCVNGCGAYGGTVGCDYDDVITEPTCTAGGYTTHTCKICGYSYTDAETPENGHDFSVYVEEVTPATCLANATATYKCANCTETTVKAVPDSQLDHSYTGDVKKNDDGTHSFLCVNGCGAYGGTVGCDYDDVITEPTCTDGGYTTHTCKICGYSYTDAETPENGHDFRVYVEEVTPATCLANATATYKCANCTETTVKAVPDSQLDHSYTGGVKKNGDGTHSFLCVNGCGAYGGTVGCDYDDVVTEPTCTAGGYTTHTCKVCGYSYTDAETPESGHDFTGYVKNVTAATCVENRVDRFKCVSCEETEDREVENSKDPANHVGEEKTENLNAVDATCVKEGSYDVVVTCLSCNQVKSTTHKEGVLDPDNHSGETRTAEEDVIPGTCVSPRKWNEVTRCADCGAVLSSIAHTGTEDPANHAGPMELRGRVEATEDENGFSGDKYCAACNTLVEAGQSVHRTKGACNYCGGFHEGIWGSVVTAVHGILWLFRQLLRIG